MTDNTATTGAEFDDGESGRFGEELRPLGQLLTSRWFLQPFVLGAIALALVPLQASLPPWVGRAVGALSILMAVALLATRWRQMTQRAALIGTSVLLVGFGVLLVLVPAGFLSLWLIVFGLINWLLAGVTISQTMRAADPPPSSYSSLMELTGVWLADRGKSAGDRRALYNKILYDGPEFGPRVGRFFTLMTFAAIIASLGAIADSTALLIGAMLVAPLMTPLMGMAISLVMGWPNRLATSAGIAFGGITVAIGVGALSGFLFGLDVATNSQVQARINPTLLDLGVALAAGVAGAYGLSRPDVSDSLPGVAIAISLVPPLCVVGLCWSQGEFVAGEGALLLFLTNAVAILAMGGVTFVVTGVTPLDRLHYSRKRLQTTGFALAGFAMLILAGLALNGAEIATNAARTTGVNDASRQWLDEYPDHSLVNAEMEGGQAVLTVVGPSNPVLDPEPLAQDLADRFNQDVDVKIRLVVQETLTASATES